MKSNPDFRVFYANNVKDAIKMFNDYWDNREGFDIISILDNCTNIPIME